MRGCHDNRAVGSLYIEAARAGEQRAAMRTVTLARMELSCTALPRRDAITGRLATGPLNFLLVSVLERYRRFFGDELTVEYPTGSGQQRTLEEVINDMWDRLISIFLVGPDGRRPCFGWVERMQRDPNWKNNLLFNEYFHGDNGAGLGASHQTGWTGLVADMIRRRHGAVQPLGYYLRASDPRTSVKTEAAAPRTAAD